MSLLTTQKTASEMIHDLMNAGYTQKRLAYLLTVSKDTIGSWAIGRRKPNLVHRETLFDLWKKITQPPPPPEIKLRWTWEQDDGGTSSEDVYIPIDVWKQGVDAIGIFITDIFAKKWSVTRKDPGTAYGYYFVGHLPGFTAKLRARLQEAYRKKNTPTDRRGS